MRDGQAAASPTLVPPIPRRIEGRREVICALAHQFTDRTEECLVVLHLSEDWDHLQFSCHKGGTENIIVPLKKIATDALELSTSGVIMAHNHLSGDGRPSKDDLTSTRYLAQVLEQLDVTLLDHLIYAAGEWTSLRREGYL